MGIFSRFADIVNSNINALLDKAEDPEKLIRLIIQEMEDTLVEVRTSSARTIAEKKELTQQIERLNTNTKEWERKAELALSKDRDDLAKAALIERNKAAEAAKELETNQLKLEQELSHLSTEVSQLQNKLNDARARQKTLVMRHKTTSSRLKVKQSLYDGSAEDAVARFEHFEKKIDELESTVESYDVGNNNLADEINELEEEEGIDKQLDELKTRINKRKKAK